MNPFWTMPSIRFPTMDMQTNSMWNITTDWTVGIFLCILRVWNHLDFLDNANNLSFTLSRYNITVISWIKKWFTVSINDINRNIWKNYNNKLYICVEYLYCVFHYNVCRKYSIAIYKWLLQLTSSYRIKFPAFSWLLIFHFRMVLRYRYNIQIIIVWCYITKRFFWSFPINISPYSLLFI